jgi:hypothetical protein
MVDRPIAFQELLQVSSASRPLEGGPPTLRSAAGDAIRHAFGVRNNGDRRHPATGCCSSGLVY